MTSAHDAQMARRHELTRALAHVQDRISAACDAAGRPRSEVQLIVVTKYFPATDIELLCQLGVTDIGESRDQEASVKLAALPTAVRQVLQVHFVGQLQSNKAGSLVTYADTVHSVDRPKLVLALDRAAAALGRDIGVLVQVRLGGDSEGAGRGGIPLDGVADLANRVVAAQHLSLRGLMAVAPLHVDPGEAFTQLAIVSRDLRAQHSRATWISAGMSADLEAAVANGATHLRVGSAILGSRPALG